MVVPQLGINAYAGAPHPVTARALPDRKRSCPRAHLVDAARTRHEARMHSTRREFLASVSLFGASLFVLRGLVACGVPEGELIDRSEDRLTTCGPAVISANHGHTLVVPPEDVTAGETKTYSIKGASSHDHKVTITAAQFAELAAGATLDLASTTAGTHAHTVTVTCAKSTDVDASTSSPACTSGAEATSIGSNHRHSLSIPAADIAAGLAGGAAKTYSILGTSTHDHTITVTPSQFAELAAGRTVTVVSSTTGTHSHTVTLGCAGSADASTP